MAKAKKTNKRKTQTIDRAVIAKSELMERKEQLKRSAWTHCPCERPDTMPDWVALGKMLNDYPYLFGAAEAKVIMARVAAGSAEILND